MPKMPTCPALQDIGNNSDTRGYLGCDREVDHPGMHYSADYGIWWFPKAPALEVFELPQAREIDPALAETLGRLRGGIEL